MDSEQWAKQKKENHPCEGLEYKTFTPEMNLEKSIFAECSFAKPEAIEVSPLWEDNKPLWGITCSKMTKYQLADQKNLDHFWNKDFVLIKALMQYLSSQGMLKGKTQ